MATLEFLQQGIKQVRKSIKDIDDSYNNDWDIIAELTQNAVDAIRLSGRNDGEIYLKIDSQHKAISITDNGIGIDPERLPELLAPFATDKEDDEKSIGEKGVGLTFVLFSCNDFYIKSGNTKGTSEGKVNDAYLWKNSSNNEQLPLIHNYIDEKYIGTEVSLKKVYDSPIFQLSFNQLEFVLRTRTSIGNTNVIWNDDTDISVTLTHINQDGKEISQKIPFRYWLPIDKIGNGKIDVNEFHEYIKIDRTDQDKRKKLKDKIIYKKVTYNHNGRSIRVFACFVPKRKIWDDLTVHFKVATEDQLTNNDWLDKFSYATFYSGIFTSVKGMPTGVTVDHPITGAQGAWPQIFIIFDDRHLKFDIGRKSIHGMQARIYKNYARELFREFQRLTKYISGDPIDIDKEWDKEEMFAEIDHLIDLNIPNIHLKKTPREQEGSVAGLFFECIGNGKITEINPLVSGYRNKYDLYAKWGNKKVVIEFKSKLSNVLKDFNDETKLFNELNCIVCWDVTENDKQFLSDKGIDIEEIQQSSLPGTTSQVFPSATHRLSLSGFVSPVYVIDLKKIIKA